MKSSQRIKDLKVLCDSKFKFTNCESFICVFQELSECIKFETRPMPCAMRLLVLVGKCTEHSHFWVSRTRLIVLVSTTKSMGMVSAVVVSFFEIWSILFDDKS